MAQVRKIRADRSARERVRLYEARREFHASVINRRTRDNVIAAIGGGALILVLIGAQVLYVTAGPGAPAPSPSVTTPVAPTPSPTASPSDTPSPTPSVSATP